jgi:hypothetical protein
LRVLLLRLDAATSSGEGIIETMFEVLMTFLFSVRRTAKFEVLPGELQ